MENNRRSLIIVLLVSSLLFTLATLSPPDGNTIDFAVKAKGFQIYSCGVSNNNTGQLSWFLQRAEAELYDSNSHTLLGFHYFLPKPDAGGGRPTWSLLQNPGSSSSDLPSSTVTGKLISKVPGEPGSIDDLLVQATSHSGHTRLSRVSYIQRIENRGGVAPSSHLCRVRGQTQAIAYESDYVFWTQQQAYISDGHAVDCGSEHKSTRSSRPLLLLFAEGFQHYQFNGSGWNLVNASALLSSIPGQEVVGEHFFLESKDSGGGQPTWSTVSPSSSVTARPEKTVRAATKDCISWVDLQATSNTGDKYSSLGAITYVQRRSTRGGLPPQESKSAKAGDLFLSPYTAVYWFYVSS